MFFFILCLIMTKLFSDEHILIAHRASDISMPENTMESLKRMEAKGATWFEIDCHLMKSGQIALLHDVKLKRTTTGKGKITKLTAAELRDVFVLGGDGGEKIPFLPDVLDYCHKKNLHVMVEVKGKDLELVDKLDALISAYRSDLFVIYSFEKKVIRAFIEKNPDYEIRWSFEKISDRKLRHAKELGVSLNLNGRYLRQSDIEKIKGEGLDIHVYTVNKEKRAKELFDWGVTAIVTDSLIGDISP